MAEFPCTFNTTRKQFAPQFFYSCYTCSKGKPNVGCCLACAVTCHKGHKLSELKHSPFYCDCGAGELSDGVNPPFECLNVPKNTSKLRQYDPKACFSFDVQGNLPIVASQQKLVDATKLLDQLDDIKVDNIEASSFDPADQYICDRYFSSKFLQTIEIAYSNHYPLKLSPSHFLLMISQGLATHINQNAEELRKHLVNYEGKKKLLVVMDDYQYGQPYDWTKVFDKFTEMINTDVNGDIYSVVKDEFSCSTPLTRACADVALMDCMKSFCEYYGSACCCGIRRIILDGTPDDWKLFKDKVYKLNDLNTPDDKLKLKWWLDALIPVINKICEAGISHVVDPEFWSRIYNFESGSGYAFASGWCTVFYPYFKNDDKVRGGIVYKTKKNTNMDWANGESRIDIGNDPSNISSVDFTLHYEKEFTEDFKMKFHAGFFGTMQYDDLTVEPLLGWVVNHTDEKPQPTAYVPKAVAAHDPIEDDYEILESFTDKPTDGGF